MLTVIGWREWLALPELGIERIKAKIDTGARTSALHAYKLEPFERDGENWLRFEIHPFQDDNQTRRSVEAKLLEYRKIKSSNGRSEERPVIVTTLRLAGQSWPIEITLTRRDSMGFRMLLGRQAMRQRVLVDVGRSFLISPSQPQESDTLESELSERTSL